MHIHKERKWRQPVHLKSMQFIYLSIFVRRSEKSILLFIRKLAWFDAFSWWYLRMREHLGKRKIAYRVTDACGDVHWPGGEDRLAVWILRSPFSTNRQRSTLGSSGARIFADGGLSSLALSLLSWDIVFRVSAVEFFFSHFSLCILFVRGGVRRVTLNRVPSGVQPTLDPGARPIRFSLFPAPASHFRELKSVQFPDMGDCGGKMVFIYSRCIITRVITKYMHGWFDKFAVSTLGKIKLRLLHACFICSFGYYLLFIVAIIDLY